MPKNSATQKLFEDLRDRIARGELAVGSKLPSVRDLAVENGVSVNTAQRTLAKLSAQNLIDSGAGRRTSVVVARTSRVVPARAIRGRQVASVLEVSHLGDERNSSIRQWGSTVADAIGAVLHQHGVQLVTIPYERTTNDVAGSLREQFDHMGDKLIGVVSFPGRASSLCDSFHDAYDVPWVTINRTRAEWSYNFVSADYFGAGRRVGTYFAEVAAKRILLMGVNTSHSTSWQEITAGVIQSCLENRMPLSGISMIEFESHGGASGEAQACDRLSAYLAENPPPDNIVAAGDYLAIGAVRACRKAGLSVPDDVNVIGGAGAEMTKFTDPPLSVIAQPVERIGHEAGNLIIEMLHTGVNRLPGRIIPTPLALRGSTRVPESLKSQLRHVASEYHFSDIST
jgi:DNA-binding LacI/PurR family transcriptional regulator